MLYFNLFDQNRVAEKLAEGKVIIKTENRYLGSFSLPLLTVFLNPPKLEGMFRVERPLSLQGYRTSLGDPYSPMTEGEDNIDYLHPHVHTYIGVNVSLEPTLELPQEQSEYYPGYEDPQFLFQITQMIKGLRSQKRHLQKRFIKIWAETPEGVSVFLPRYIRPIKPPKELGEDPSE